LFVLAGSSGTGFPFGFACGKISRGFTANRVFERSVDGQIPAETPAVFAKFENIAWKNGNNDLARLTPATIENVVAVLGAPFNWPENICHLIPFFDERWSARLV
jgi:hypothetical protein